MDFSRTGVEIGPFDLFGITINPTLHFYGLIAVTGILLGTMLAAWLAKKDDKNPDHVWNGVIWAVIGGLIGARIWFVLFLPAETIATGRDTAWMLSNFFDLNDGPLAIWTGGLGIYGGVIGGLVGILLYARYHKLKNVLEWIDIAAMALPLGHAIGRWGNYVNQELYGKPTNLPWAISIERPSVPLGDYAGFHPLFFYEFAWNLVLCGFLVWLWFRYREQIKAGTIFLLYIVGYNIIRALLEFLRVETARLPGTNINSSQTISALLALLALAGLAYLYRPSARPRFHADGRPVGRSKKEKS